MVTGIEAGWLSVVPALAVAFIVYRLQGNVPSLKDGADATLVGFNGILLAAVILMFASSIQNAVSLLGIGAFITETFGDIPAFIVPVAVFATTSFVSFSDGSSWSTYGIMFPIAIPLAFATGANLHLVLGAVFSGGIFGDHTSPISDTTVLASSTSGSDHMVHVGHRSPTRSSAPGWPRCCSSRSGSSCRRASGSSRTEPVAARVASHSSPGSIPSSRFTRSTAFRTAPTEER